MPVRSASGNCTAGKNVSFERIDVNLEAKPDWFLTLSPTGKLPLLKVEFADNSDMVLFESGPFANIATKRRLETAFHKAEYLDARRAMMQ
ncbi:glutathione S-transferase N-terminal domain-containing protein [Pectobacterium betavasculorum]|uniref:glutathione S-transferase N-terminal domain-containing protein n=1 Tax=Pectobacterium betavasculorum TaxID=55207 RepID=UPI00068A147C|nr:glutathione S-transferase N-terminal domain-containing protein [Pectobacterium betavasculorum]